MPQQSKILSHSLYECKYRVAFCPKYRYRIWRDEVTEYVRQRIYQLRQQKDDVEVLELQEQPDHVHLGSIHSAKVRGLEHMGMKVC